jgi:hypothetical protein
VLYHKRGAWLLCHKRERIAVPYERVIPYQNQTHMQPSYDADLAGEGGCRHPVD